LKYFLLNKIKLVRLF